VAPGTCPPGIAGLSAEQSKQRACGGKCEPAECVFGPCAPELVVEDSEGISVLELDDSFLYWAAGTLKTRDDESGRFTIRRMSGDGTVEDVATAWPSI
jgi:hypothetical protein